MDIIGTLKQLGNKTKAVVLCDRLVELGYSRKDAQLAIQRAIEKNKIKIESDWTLSLYN